jgi:hypothetical protein
VMMVAEQIKQAGDRAAALTGRLLTFSRRQVSHPEELDLNVVLEGLTAMLKGLVGDRIELVVLPGRDQGTADLRRTRFLVVSECAKRALQKKSFGVFCPTCGEVTERPKVHDWKSCVPQGTEGSNPSLSASFNMKPRLREGFEAERALTTHPLRQFQIHLSTRLFTMEGRAFGFIFCLPKAAVDCR